MITVMVQPFVVFSCETISALHQGKIQLFAQFKSKQRFRSVRNYVGARDANPSREGCLCVSVLRERFQLTVSSVLIMSFRHGGDMIQTAVATLKQMN